MSDINTPNNSTVNPPKQEQGATTNVAPLEPKGAKTNVGKPVRHWGKRIALILLILPIVAAGVYGVQHWLKVSKTYKVGSHSFTYGDVEARAAKMKKGFSGKVTSQAQDQMLSDAKDKLALLAGLKSEADKRNIPYDNASVDNYMKTRYDEKGGKSAYFAYTKSDFGWNEQDTYNFGTTLYLQYKLEPELIAHKRFTVIYVRWDGIKLFDPKNYDTVYKQREAELTNKYLPMLKQNVPLEGLRQRVEVSDTADQETIRRVYAATKNAPIQIQDFDPTGVTFTNYNEGEDVMTRLNAMKQPLGVVGPFKGADGRLLIARLESARGGKYYGWDEFTKQAKQSAGLSQNSVNVDIGMLSKRFARQLDGIFSPAQKAEAAQSAINCLDHPVTYNFSVFSTASGDRIWSPTFTMGGGSQRQIAPNNSGELYYCDPAPYRAAGFSVGQPDANGFTGVGIFKTSSLGTLTFNVDCYGGDWGIGPKPPSLGSGWTFKYQNTSGSYGNNMTINTNFYYAPVTQNNPPPPPPPPPPSGNNPYCTFTNAYRVDATRWAVSWRSYNYYGAALSGSLYNSVTGNTDSGVGLSENDHRVRVADGQTGTISFTMYNNGQPVPGVTCSIPVGQTGSNPPPTNPPPPTPTAYWSCAVTADGTSPIASPATPANISKTINRGDTLTLKVAPVLRLLSDDTIVPGGMPLLQWDYFVGSFGTPVYTSPDPTRVGGNPDPFATYTSTPQVSANYFIFPHNPQEISVYGGCSVVLQVNTPAAPTYGPLLKTTKGDVTAAGFLDSANAMIRTQKNNPPRTAVATAADYLVIGRFVDYFCSAGGFNLGMPGTCVPGDSLYSSGYAVSREGFANIGDNGPFATSNDPVIKNVRTIMNSASTDINACSAAKPYFKYADLGPQLAGGNFGSTQSCAVIGTQPSGNFGAHTFTQGRATIFIDGDVTITGDNKVVYSGGPYDSVNKIPNVGLIVRGNVTIDKSVVQLDMSIYATGKIKTCSVYPDATGTQCNQQLKVRGILAAAHGFEFGRIIPGNPANAADQAKPAELIVGSGLVDAFPPPGFIDMSTSSATGVKVLSNEAGPRF